MFENVFVSGLKLSRLENVNDACEGLFLMVLVLLFALLFLIFDFPVQS